MGRITPLWENDPVLQYPGQIPTGDSQVQGAEAEAAATGDQQDGSTDQGDQDRDPKAETEGTDPIRLTANLAIK